MTDEELVRGNEIKCEIKALLNKLEIFISHNESTKSNYCSDSEIKIHNSSTYAQDILILNENEVMAILDFLIERTKAKIKKLEEEFKNL